MQMQMRATGATVKAPVLSRPVVPIRSRLPSVVVRSESSRSDSFATGFILGGVIFGALGFLFAPQISKAMLSDDQRLKLPRFLEEEKDPEQTRQDLIDKIAQLNASIDEVAGKLKVPEANGSLAEAIKIKA